MALKTLEGVEEIGGFKVGLSLEDAFVAVNEQRIGFQIQDGPIKEKGVNGCQVDTMIAAAKKIIEGLNQGDFECVENHYAIAGLNHALHWMEQRKVRREAEKTEGTSQA